MLSIATLLLALFAQAALGEEHYHIVPVNSTSLCQQHPKGTCFTLDTFPSIMDNKENGNITLSFYPGEHLLTRDMVFTNTQSVTLINEHLQPNVYPRIRCIENTGLYITNTISFTMQGLVIYGCVSKEPVIQVEDVETFHMQECKIIENFRKHRVEECYDYDYDGIIYISSKKAVIKSIDFTNNKYVMNIINQDCVLQTSSVLQVLFSRPIIIDTCHFENNTVYSTIKRSAGPQGGAVSLFDCHAHITNTTFVGNQIEGNGAAIAISSGSVIDNVLVVNNSLFDNNRADGDGGAIFTYLLGTLQINKSIFRNNRAERYGGAILSNALTVNINNSIFDSNKCYEGVLDIHAGSCEKLCTIINSNFVNNEAYYMGGGISFKDLNIANAINLYFFNNRANHGGAISIERIKDTINISYSIFENNQATDKGGAINVEDHSTVNIICSIFDSNQALLGGAISVDTSTVTFDQLSPRTEITRNRAISNGAGIYINSNSKLYVYGNMLIADNIAHIDGGGIYVTGENEISFQFSNGLFNKICTRNNINILNNTALNDGGGVYLASTSVSIQDSNTMVSDNHADRFGGGLFFVDNSKVVLNICDQADFDNYYLHLKSNSAQKGGGVYVSDEPCSLNHGSMKSCFLSTFYLSLDVCYKYDDYNCDNQKKKFTHFENNIAMVTGSDIYGGMLDTCAASIVRYFILEFPDRITYGKQFMRENVRWTWGNKHYDTIGNDADFFNHISSDPMKVCFCVDNIVNCTFTHPTVHKKKGETFTLSLVVTDQLGKPVNASLHISLNSTIGGEGRFKAGQQFRTIPDQCTELEYNVYYDQNKTVLDFYPDGSYGNLAISKKEVNIVFDPCTCPLGFYQQHDPIDCSCDCTEALKPHINHCWREEGTFQLNDNNWIQNINNTGFIIHTCPFDYCKTATDPVNISLSDSSDMQCAFNRTGIMCGKCDQGLSMVFATSQCQQCSDSYLFLLIPFGLAGIALVAFILLLNMTVATGTIHGLIFYANILAANRSVFISSGNVNVLTVFVSWLNLDLGIDTCFYNGMDSYGKLMLQLVFPAYVFFLIITTIVLCDRSQRIARLFGKRNPEATLYTLFLLSYSKLIRTIITALQFTTLDYPDGSQEIVWLYDANVRYFALNHIPRFLVALIITILGAVYTSLLLFGQLFNKCSEYRMMKWTSHKYYIHFMKVHHAPLSDNHRYWVGLLLLARLTHYIISAFTNDIIVVLSALIITLLLLVFRPYSKTFLNFLGNCFVLNLSVFSGATLYVKLSGGNQQALAIVSMSISFIAFLGIVFYHILDSCEVKPKNVLIKILRIYTYNRNRDNIEYHPVAIVDSEDENTEDEIDEELIDLSNIPEDNATVTNEPYDPTCYITPPVIRSALRYDQLREPAMDDLCPLTPADYNLHPAAPPIKNRKKVATTEIVIT